MKVKKETKSIKVSDDVHGKLKVYVAKKKISSITDFVDKAILEKIKNDK